MIMKTSWHGNTFGITSTLWRESTSHQQILPTRWPEMQFSDNVLLLIWGSLKANNQVPVEIRHPNAHVMMNIVNPFHISGVVSGEAHSQAILCTRWWTSLMGFVLVLTVSYTNSVVKCEKWFDRISLIITTQSIITWYCIQQVYCKGKIVHKLNSIETLQCPFPHCLYMGIPLEWPT